MKKTFNILSLNGGGIKGLKSLVQLVEIEKQLETPLLDHFDLIAGTSTGGIIAAMLAKGYQAKDLLGLYVEHGDKIFKKRFLSVIRNPKYKDDYINNLLTLKFGEVLMSELKVDVLIPAYNGTTRDYTFFKKNGVTSTFFVRDAVRATMSAQVYFKPHQIGNDIYIDGGNGLNNPSMDALQEAMDLNTNNLPINLIVIGTGKVEKPLKAKNGIIKWLINSVDINMTEAEQLTQKRVEYAFAKKTLPNLAEYVYLDSPVYYSSTEMDDASQKNIENLIKDGKMAYRQNAEKIEFFISKIK